MGEEDTIHMEKKKKRNKRKKISVGNVEDEEPQHHSEKPFKFHRFDGSSGQNEDLGFDLKEGPSWRNLRLILSLQDKSMDLLKKVDLAFDYVNSSSTKEMFDTVQSPQVANTSRTLVFLNNWVQTIFIYSEKKTRIEQHKPEFETSGAYLDLRCWKILHFCLEKSKDLHLLLTCSKDFLRVIRCIVMDASCCVNSVSFCSEGTCFGERLEFHNIVLDCMSLIFSFHGGVANENLDLWITLMDKLLELILKKVWGQPDGSKLCDFILQLSCYLLEPFVKFLRIHPTRKSGYYDFIDKLLEPLLHLLYLLHSDPCGNNIEWRTNLSKLVEDALAQGLFHPTHIDGFLSLRSACRFVNSFDATPKEEKAVNKSYHRHLFDKVEKIVEKNELALVGLGELLHLFVSCAIKHKGASHSLGGSRRSGVAATSNVPIDTSQSRTLITKENAGCHSMDAELRKSIFFYFVQIMEYLLADINTVLQSDVEEVSVLLKAPNKLRSINNLLASFIYQKIYLRIEDTTEGVSRKFLRFIFDMVISFSAKITHLQPTYFCSDEKSVREFFVSVRKELIITVHHLLNIEYEVVEDDLESLWAMVFTSVDCSYSSMDVLDHSLLFSEILSLGCRLIDLYSELRQVNSSISAFCKALRLSVSLLGNSKSCIPSRTSSSYSNALSMLLCSLEFRISLSNAVKTIPEGQAAECIQQLSSDIMETLEWMKFECQLAGECEMSQSNQRSCNLPHFDYRAEILGRALSEAYMIITDSITVSLGNSYLIGISVKNLVEIIRPSLTSLVSLRPDRIKEFSKVVDGRTLSKRTRCKNLSTCWILVFFFRLLLSCRSLLRLVISRMPPGTAKKISRLIGELFTPHSGRDWIEMSVCADEGFFSWIIQPSAPLLDVMNSVSDIYIQDSQVLCPPLVYILNAMAIQRLADLNRLIMSSEYVLLDQTLNESKLKNDTNLSSYSKRMRKWRKSVSEMREEAAGLTNFMMESLSSVAKDQISAPSVDGGIDATFIQALLNNDLNLALGSVDNRSLPTILWWTICQNVDVWGSYAAKKDLKNFLMLLIQASISYESDCGGSSRMHNINQAGQLSKVTAQQIAMVFLRDTIMCEQSFVRRYMASRFCRILQKSVLSMFVASEVDLSKSPDWVEVISALGNLSDVQIGAVPQLQSSTVSTESCNQQTINGFAVCQRLLALFMQMPDDYLSSRSSSLYLTCTLNLERLLVGSLLGWHGASCMNNTFEIFQLFVSCRRVLQKTVSCCKDNINGHQPALTSKLLEGTFPMSWMLKSLTVVVGFQRAFPEDIALKAQVEICSLMDNTSNALQTVSRARFNSLISAWKLCREGNGLDSSNKESDLSECKLLVNDHENLVAWESLLQVAETLAECMQNCLTNFRDASLDKKVQILGRELNKLSSMVAGFQGLLWGLASALGDIIAVDCNFGTHFSSFNAELMNRIDSCVCTCMDFTTFFLKELLLEDDPSVDMPVCSKNLFGTRKSTSGGNAVFSDSSNGGEMHPSLKMIPSDKMAGVIKCSLKRSHLPAIPELETFLTKVQHEKYCLKRFLLLELLIGENVDTALFIRQLFIACSAILRLHLQIYLSISWSRFSIVVNISQLLLLEFSNSSEMPNQFAFFWLDGVVAFLEELGNCFPRFDPSLSRDLYVKLVGLHLRAIGKCISLQGKEAKLASHERGSHAKILANPEESYFNHETNKMVEFQARLRMSFRSYVRKSSELHLLTAIQAVERALAGVKEGLMTNYEIFCGSLYGGEVSSVVAGGIDCLDLILEFVTGHKRLSMIKRHIQSLVACLFNVILHLQAPSIFYGHMDTVKTCVGPDSGSIVLMCVEVLTKISGKPSFFQIDACHIAESLRVPTTLFEYFLQVRSTSNSAANQKFSIELYAACCRLICTTLKHHKTETWQCISLLEDSVSVLLSCLEIVSIDLVAGRDILTWGVKEAVKCASSLRRVYEEVRQQNDVFGQNSFQFLSRYIWIYCGFGPAKKGIKREVDEALKPGIYALIDSCSADDLQLLHTVFGEGPCRSTLAALQHDYEHNFQFQGKV